MDIYSIRISKVFGIMRSRLQNASGDFSLKKDFQTKFEIINAAKRWGDPPLNNLQKKFITFKDLTKQLEASKVEKMHKVECKAIRKLTTLQLSKFKTIKVIYEFEKEIATLDAENTTSSRLLELRKKQFEAIATQQFHKSNSTSATRPYKTTQIKPVRFQSGPFRPINSTALFSFFITTLPFSPNP
ncbi:hypothetical protein JHK85_022094 [Glycine max]|nr:hypothetical protein JHK85_022094 [Glycine max]